MNEKISILTFQVVRVNHRNEVLNEIGEFYCIEDAAYAYKIMTEQLSVQFETGRAADIQSRFRVRRCLQIAFKEDLKRIQAAIPAGVIVEDTRDTRQRIEHSHEQFIDEKEILEIASISM